MDLNKLKYCLLARKLQILKIDERLNNFLTGYKDEKSDIEKCGFYINHHNRYSVYSFNL